MRCKKCKKWLPLLTRYCSNCGTAVVLEQRLKSEWLMLLGLTVVLFVLSYAAGRTDGGQASASSLTAAVAGLGGAIFVLLLALAVIFCFAFVDLVRFAVRKPKFIPLPVLAVLLLAGGGYGAYLLASYASLTGMVPMVQDNLVEVAASKLMGDKLARGKSAPEGYAWWRVQASSQRAAQIVTNLPLPDRLDAYGRSAVVWAAKMADASKDPKSWPSVPDAPSEFELALSGRSAERLFDQNLKDILALKEFGDSAIKNKNTKALRYIAARLLVQRHWLQNLLRSKDPGFLAMMPVPAAQAAGDRKICIQQAAKTVCAADIQGNVELVYRAALDILDGVDKAEAAWDEAWGKFSAERGLAVAKPAEAGAKYPPTVQAFVDECYEHGGELGAKIEKRDQLPTDEGGNTCGFVKGKAKCWDLLTDSGGRYGGGESGCPQVGIIPAVIAQAWTGKPSEDAKPAVEAKPSTQAQKGTGTPAAKPKTANWDGNYTISGVLDCGGSIPGTEPKLPINTGFSISGNAFTDVNGIRRTISPQGTVTVYNDQIIQGMNGAFKMTYKFTLVDGVAKVSGSATVDLVLLQGTTRYESRCAGTLSGSRR